MLFQNNALEADLKSLSGHNAAFKTDSSSQPTIQTAMGTCAG
jgi:hypothetical protein